jgi:serine protease inhibitor
MPAKLKQPKLTTLKKKLDRIFSEYIRRRNADSNGFVKCYTCCKTDHWKNMDCGHWQKRQHLATRYNEINCQTQCRACNWLKQGNDYQFEKKLRLQYGENKVNLLMMRNSSNKIERFEYEFMIKEYTQKLKEL